MAAPAESVNTWANTWPVLRLFLIPVGGGIPSGVLLAKSSGIGWPLMAVLYFISDVILACIFEPLMLGVIAAGKRFKFFARLGQALKQSTQKTTARFGTKLGPLALVMIAFGVDPMTGRATAKAAGHGFVSGWALAITGDMIYFAVLAISTLSLNNFLDESKTTMIILIGMFVVPELVKKLRDRKNTAPTGVTESK